MKHLRLVLVFLFFSSLSLSALAQVGAEIEVEKPKKYENRTLRAEKTGEKKLSLPKRFYQNTVTHYNYYFNANQRLNDLVEMAAAGTKDDYTRLLPFYNYSLEATSQNKTELDSIIYKCTAGILLHDLRNDWIDNMFLLLAKAYFFRNDLDSANLTLQYINFSFAPKEAGGYDIPIGSNSSNEKNEFTISTKESKSIFKKVFSRPPSRNESFIWQIRTLIERNELGEAAGIIEILKNDPHFPKRLDIDLHEATAYWYYKQKLWDSAAHHLALAIPNAKNTEGKARWEFLTGQLYQLAKNKDLASRYYQKAMDHTIDPVMDVYARLNALKLQNAGNQNFLQDNIDALHNMAKKDKYEAYRDIIYYAAATIELDRKNYPNAEKDLLNSVAYTANNPAQRSQAFFTLPGMKYDQEKYIESSNFYDSLDGATLNDTLDRNLVNLRKPFLKIIADNYRAIKEQDSLQALAKLTPEEREAFIKKAQKKLNKDKGNKEENSFGGNSAVRQPLPDLFSSTEKEKGNEFYFYNSSLKARGFSEFKARWGERPNVDNWRRKSAIDRMTTKLTDVDDASVDKGDDNTTPTDTSSLSLSNTIPVTPEELKASNKVIIDGLFKNGETFLNKLENYPAAIQAYEELLSRFPDNEYKDEILFNLVYACQKTGDKAKVEKYKAQLLAGPGDSKWKSLAKNPSSAKNNDKSLAATKKYEEIYNLFIEGKFDAAVREKKLADSIYDKSFWTPQLLFIEAIYYIKLQEDSTAIKVLTDLSAMYKGNIMAEKANTMIEVLKKRKEIEAYLSSLEIKKADDGSVSIKTNFADPALQSQPSSLANNTKIEVKPDEKPKNEDNQQVNDSTNNAPAIAPSPDASIPQNEDTSASSQTITFNDFIYSPVDPHYAVVLLDQVDPVFISEAKNAFNRYNKEKFYSQTIPINNAKLDDRYTLLLQGPFPTADAAVDYIDKIRPFTPSRILPWLTATKYSYMVISDDNLETLKENKDMNGYKQLLQLALPGKF